MRTGCLRTRERVSLTIKRRFKKKHIKPAAKTAGIAITVGWKTFRHSFRSWLDQTEAPIGVQRELMRHASIQTTMNIYGKAMTDGKPQAHSRVVEMVLNPRKPGTQYSDEGDWELMGVCGALGNRCKTSCQRQRILSSIPKYRVVSRR